MSTEKGTTCIIIIHLLIFLTEQLIMTGLHKNSIVYIYNIKLVIIMGLNLRFCMHAVSLAWE